LDVHARSVFGRALDGETGEVVERRRWAWSSFPMESPTQASVWPSDPRLFS